MLTGRRGARLPASLAMALLVGALDPRSSAQPADGPTQVLVLSSTRQDEQFSVVVEREVPKLLAEGLNERVDFYAEYFDFLRFPQGDYQSVYLDFLRQKYERRRFDLLILMGDVAISFMESHRD